MGVKQHNMAMMEPMIPVLSGLKFLNERYQSRGKPRTLSSAASGGVLNPKGNKLDIRYFYSLMCSLTK